MRLHVILYLAFTKLLLCSIQLGLLYVIEILSFTCYIWLTVAMRMLHDKFRKFDIGSVGQCTLPSYKRVPKCTIKCPNAA